MSMCYHWIMVHEDSITALYCQGYSRVIKHIAWEILVFYAIYMATRPRARACIFHKTLGLMLYLLHVLQEYWQTTHTHTHICRCAPYLKSRDGLAPFTWVYRADNGRLRVSTNGRLKDTGQLWITVRHVTPGGEMHWILHKGHSDDS